MGIKKFVLDKTNLIYALPILAVLAIVGIGMIEEQKKEWRIFPSEGVVFYNSSIEKEIQKFNEHFQGVQAKWGGEGVLLLHFSGPYEESRHTPRTKLIEGLESVIVSGDFCLELYKQGDRSWGSFMQDLIVVLDEYIE